VNHRRVPAPLILAQEAHVVVGDRRTGIEPGRGLVLPLRRGRFAQREEDDAQARVGVAYAGKPLVRFDEEGATAVRSPVSASSRRPARASACPRSTRNGPWVGHCVTARRSRGTADPTRPCDSRTAPRASSQVIRVTGMYSPRSLVVQAQQSSAAPRPTKLEVAEEHPRVVPGDEPVVAGRDEREGGGERDDGRDRQLPAATRGLTRRFRGAGGWAEGYVRLPPRRAQPRVTRPCTDRAERFDPRPRPRSPGRA